MRWPSLFALLQNCEVECVNINQMVPVILKQASLPATHPLPPLSTALTFSSHFSSQAFAAISFVLKSCYFWHLISPCFFSWAGATFFSLPGQALQPQAVGFHLTTSNSSPIMSPNIAVWASVAQAPVKPSAAHQAHSGWLCLLFKWTQFAFQGAQPSRHHKLTPLLPIIAPIRAIECPGHGRKPSLDLVPKHRGQVGISPIPLLNRKARELCILIPLRCQCHPWHTILLRLLFSSSLKQYLW